MDTFGGYYSAHHSMYSLISGFVLYFYYIPILLRLFSFSPDF